MHAPFCYNACSIICCLLHDHKYTCGFISSRNFYGRLPFTMPSSSAITLQYLALLPLLSLFLSSCYKKIIYFQIFFSYILWNKKAVTKMPPPFYKKSPHIFYFLKTLTPFELIITERSAFCLLSSSASLSNSAKVSAISSSVTESSYISSYDFSS